MFLWVCGIVGNTRRRIVVDPRQIGNRHAAITCWNRGGRKCCRVGINSCYQCPNWVCAAAALALSSSVPVNTAPDAVGELPYVPPITVVAPAPPADVIPDFARTSYAARVEYAGELILIPLILLIT